MRTVRTGSTKLPVVITVVTVRAQNLRSHGAALPGTVNVQHVGSQARLRKRTATNLHDWMLRSRIHVELRQNIERIGARGEPPGQISEFLWIRLAGANPVASQAILVLVHCRRNNTMPVDCANSVDSVLRWSDLRRSRKTETHLLSAMWIMAIRTGGVPVVIQQFALAGRM